MLSPEIHLVVQPDINFVDTEEIQIKRFDSLDLDTLNFLTLDVQGFELEVLKGFGEKFVNSKANCFQSFFNGIIIWCINIQMFWNGFFKRIIQKG